MPGFNLRQAQVCRSFGLAQFLAEELGSFAVYNVMNRVVTTGLVPTDSSTVALQPQLRELMRAKAGSVDEK